MSICFYCRVTGRFEGNSGKALKANVNTEFCEGQCANSISVPYVPCQHGQVQCE